MENEEINLPADIPQSLEIEGEGVLFWVKFFALLGIIFAVPFLPFQGITGPIVNAILFISVVILSVRSAILLALAPSLIAVTVGTLPAVLLPMVPFIIAGNIILVFIFYRFRKNNYWIAVILASVLKFLFLYSTSFIVINLIIKKQLASAVSLMMSWPQLVTALAGGVVAYFFLKVIRKI